MANVENIENKEAKRIPEKKDYRLTVGGFDFPKIITYKSHFTGWNLTWIEDKKFTFNNFDMNCNEGMRLNFIEEKINFVRADGKYKIYRKGYRILCEIPFRALRQLDSKLDVFLVTLHNAERIQLIPHRDHSWKKYWVAIENNWDYAYWTGRPYLGWKGTLVLKGIDLLSKIEMESIAINAIRI